MTYENTETGEVISDHRYKKLTEEEKKQYKPYADSNGSGDILSILGGGLIGDDCSDDGEDKK